MTIDDLIALLEKAEAPSRELDQAIHLLVLPDDLASKIIRGDMKVHEWSLGMGGICWRSDSGSSGGTWPVRHYSSSIDAALTLVPDGWLLSELLQNHPEFKSITDRGWNAGVMGPVEWASPEPGAPDEPVFDHANGTHDHPAIALCIAALKARKEQP